MHCCAEEGTGYRYLSADWWPVPVAAQRGYTSMVRQLLRLGPGPDWSANWACDSLHAAALGGHAAASELLLAAAPEAVQCVWEHKCGHGYRHHHWTLAHSAAASGSAAALAALLRLAPGAAEWATEHRYLPLHVVCQHGHLEVAKLLLHAAPNTATAAASVNGLLPLHCAAFLGDAALVALLLQTAPAIATAANFSGFTPLHSAAAAVQAATAAQLLRAAPHTAMAVDDQGFTPMHIAAGRELHRAGEGAVVALLLEAAPEAAAVKDARSKRPLDLALAGSLFDVPGLGPNLPAARLLVLASDASTGQLLDALPRGGAAAHDLYAMMVARRALSTAEWERVPTPCLCLERALPAVLARAEAEAGQLVRHLWGDDREQLRVGALCLLRAQRRHGISLPAAVVHWCLARCL